MIDVAQIDREAAAAYMKLVGSKRWSVEGILSGGCDNTSVTLAFAAHRIAAEKAVLDRLQRLIGQQGATVVDFMGEELAYRGLLQTGHWETLAAALETKR